MLKFPTVMVIPMDTYRGTSQFLQTELELTEEQTNRLMFEVPSLLKIRDIRKRYARIRELFFLYLGMKKKDVRKIFQGFHYLPLIEEDKLIKFLSLFKSYKLSHERVVNYVSSIEQFLARGCVNDVVVFSAQRVEVFWLVSHPTFRGLSSSSNGSLSFQPSKSLSFLMTCLS